MASSTFASDPVSLPPAQSAFLRIALLMAGTVALNVLAGTFSGEKLSFLYKDQLHLTASGLASLVVVLAIPNYLRPFIGAGSDFFPLFGYHRRSYYALAVLLSAFGYFGLYALPHYTYLATALLVIVTIAGGVTLLIMADAVMVTVGNQTGTVGRLQAIQQFTPPLLAIIYLARLGGYVTQHWSNATCFRAAALTALCALPLTLLIDERRVSRGPSAQETPEEHAARLEAKQAERAQTAAALRQAARTPGLWAVVAFVFYLIFTPGTNTARFYYSVDTLHFSKQFLGSLGQYGSAGFLLGIAAFAALSRRMPVVSLVLAAWLIDCSGYLLNFALRGEMSAEIITLVGSFTGIIYTLSLLTLAARACPPHIEGTIYSLFISAIGLAGTLGEKVGGSLYDFFGPTHGHSTAYAWYALNGVGLALTIPASLLILLLPAWTKSRRPLAEKPDAVAGEVQ